MIYPSISVIIPSFNQGQYLEESLISVLGQSYPKLEILVFDGGSTDNSVEILKKYDSQLTYWQSEPDEGQADAINQGMNRSSGDVLCWLNSDDLYFPGTLLNVGRKFAERGKEAHLLYGASAILNESKKEIAGDAEHLATFDKFILTYHDFISQPSTFWTRQLWEATGELNIQQNYTFDWDWFIRASQQGVFQRVQKFYSIYRYHQHHKTSTGGEKRRKEILEVVRRYSSEYWENLYERVEENYDKVKKLEAWVNSLRVPKRHKLFEFLLPDSVKKSCKDIRHLYVVLGMYG